MYQNFNDPSNDEDNNIASAYKITHVIYEEWPAKFISNWPLSIFHNFINLSTEPEIRVY